MNRAPSRVWLLGLAVLSLCASQRVWAIGPAYVMFYGGPLESPIVVQPESAIPTEFLWNTIRGGTTYLNGDIQHGTIPNDLTGRPYVKFAIFWGWWDQQPVEPEAASQHGRLYFPAASESAVVVVTPAWMDEPSQYAVGHPAARPIPADLDEHRNALGIQDGFVAGWVLSGKDLADAKRLGLPGL